MSLLPPYKFEFVLFNLLQITLKICVLCNLFRLERYFDPRYTLTICLMVLSDLALVFGRTSAQYNLIAISTQYLPYFLVSFVIINKRHLQGLDSWNPQSFISNFLVFFLVLPVNVIHMLLPGFFYRLKGCLKSLLTDRARVSIPYLISASLWLDGFNGFRDARFRIFYDIWRR